MIPRIDYTKPRGSKALEVRKYYIVHTGKHYCYFFHGIHNILRAFLFVQIKGVKCEGSITFHEYISNGVRLRV